MYRNFPLFLFISLLIVIARATGQDTNTLTYEVFKDPHFQDGFILLDPGLGKLTPYGKTPALTKEGVPSWNLAQWSSLYPLKESENTVKPDGAISYVNEGKSVVLGPVGSASADLTLGVKGKVEYAGHGKTARKEGEAWPHLLIQQAFDDFPAITELASLEFSIEAKLNEVQKLETSDYNPNLHSAIFLGYFTLQDTNPASASYNQCVWFCIPVYDDRHRVPPEYMATDAGKSDATGMFIYTLSGSVYTPDSAHDGKWITLRKDLLPLFRDALKMAWERGYLKGNRDFSDYRITTFALGWEIPGTFDAEAQIRNLSLKATRSEKPSVDSAALAENRP